MRLWHQALLPYLSNQRLLGQHRECCALRGNGWGRKHATVQYVFNHNYYYLICYHMEVMNEMEKRGFKYDEQWRHGVYRGKNCEAYPTACPDDIATKLIPMLMHHEIVYPEHDDAYLQECLKRLDKKGADYGNQIRN